MRAGQRGRLRERRRGETRLPALVAIAVAVAIYALLPQHLLVGPRFAIPAAEVVLLIPTVLISPWRLTRETRWSRVASLALVLLIMVMNLVSLGLLVHDLVATSVKEGRSLLLAALQIWATDVIVFGLAFWELDRGGPVARTQLPRDQLQAADFRFSQDEDRDTVAEVGKGSSVTSDWVPTFVDYLYVSVTNSSAFSPTDTMPLSTRVKVLMAVEATAALLTSILVISRAVSILQ